MAAVAERMHPARRNLFVLVQTRIAIKRWRRLEATTTAAEMDGVTFPERFLNKLVFMNHDRFKKVEEIYHAILKVSPKERNSFLEESCGGDIALRREVESLLSYENTFDSLIDTPPESLVAEMFSAPKSESIVGRQINQYRMISLLGKGGMGAVYLAFDSKLERKVAVKFLSDEFAEDINRRNRFFQEAKSASALNHPNILTVHEIGELDGKYFLVTEFITGKTLKKHLADERLSLRATLELALQIASALAAAHEAGIIHRDIKPDNIMVRKDGIVKVLDFGLAKLAASQKTEELNPEAATRVQEMTAAGMIMGTPQYMSPEQARGQKVDSRTDIFSFGIVLYEMIAGKPPFSGASDMDTIGAILKDELQPLGEHSVEIPQELEHIVGKALRKDREQRYQHIKDLLIDLSDLKQSVEPNARIIHNTNPAISAKTLNTTSGIVTERRFSLIHALGFLIFAAFAFTAIWWFIPKQTGNSAASILRVEEVVNWTSSPGEVYSVGTFSPDGKMVAYTSTKVGTKNIWIKQATSGESIQVTKDEFKNENPVWSPNGEELAFYSTKGNQSGFWRIPILGGAAKIITAIDDGSSRLLFWSKNNQIYYESKSDLFSVDAVSGQTKQVTSLAAKSINGTSLSLSNDENNVAFVTVEGEIYSLFSKKISAETPDILISSPTEIKNTVWHPDNQRVFYSALTNGTFQIFVTDIYAAAPRQISFSEQDCFVLNVSADGTKILYGSAKEESDVWTVNLKTANESIVASDINSELWADVSPDGKTLAYQSIKNLSQGNKLFSGKILTKVLGTNDQPVELADNGFLPKWSPDGKTLALVRVIGDQHQIETIKPSGGEKKQLTTSGILPISYSLLPYNRTQTNDFSWSPDSTNIAYLSTKNGQSNIWLANADSGNQKQLTKNVDSNLSLSCPIWSSDGKNLAYTTKTNTATDTPIYGIQIINAETKKDDPILSEKSFIKLIGWSQSGNELILASVKSSVVGLPPEVLLLNVKIATGEMRQITELKDAYLYNIQLSSDEKSIAFAAHREGKDNIWLMSANGGEAKKLTNNNDSRLYFSSLAWSPDSNSIFFGKQLRYSLLSMLTNFQ